MPKEIQARPVQIQCTF